ncbi:MAG TPA: protein kinase [Myxococcales bacterium]|jgi:serine/threonine-protein kinase
MGADASQTRFVDPRGVMVGEYRIEQPIASGGMGVIYLARNPMLGSRAAAKVLREELAVHPEIVERFLDEASLAAKLRHPNIVQVYDFVSLPDGRPCMLMEYLEGETLQRRASRGPMPLAQARPILLQVAAALEATHARGVLHLDLKAENVLLTSRDGRDDFVKLLDFGLAKGTAIAAGVELSGTLAGTPYYMAPEQVRGEGVDARADVYALGVLAYRLLVGRFPCEGQTVEEILYNQVHAAADMTVLSSPFVELLLRKALDKDPECRLPSAAEFLRALAELPLEVAFAPAPAKGRAAADEEPPSWMHGPIKTDPELPRLELIAPPMNLPKAAPPANPPKPPAPAATLNVVNPMLDPPRSSLHAPPSIAEQMASLSDSLPSIAKPNFQPAMSPQAEVSSRVPVPPHAGPAGPVPRQRTSPLASKTAAAKMAEAGTPSVVMERYLTLSDRDHYAFLSLDEDSSHQAISEAFRKVEEELKSARDRAPASIRPQLVALLGRLGRAHTALVGLEARVSYDAKRGNYKGIAKSLAAGLSPDRLEKLHGEWAARFPDQRARAIEMLAAAGRMAQGGDRQRAGEMLEQALAIDPLNPDLQRRYAALKARGP